MRAVVALPDQAQRDGCLDTLPVAPTLEPLAPFALPDGRKAVLLDTVQRRDRAIAGYIVEDLRGAWHSCRSIVRYDDAWIAAMKAAQ